MPAPTRPTARRRYNQEDVTNALEAIKSGMTMGIASKTFGVPKTTLHDKLRGKSKEVATIGRPSVLTEVEEDAIVQWVIQIGKMGFPIRKEQLIDSVARLIKDQNRINPFTNGIPGDRWYGLFLARHPIIAERVTQLLTTSRANVTENNIRQWFADIKTYMESNGLMDVFSDPKRVFNADETAFFLCPKGKTVLARKGEKSVYSVAGNDDKECLTVLLNGNAAGDLAPTMVVYTYERIPAAIVQSFPDDWAISKSESGWMTCATFYEYITNVFYPWLVKSGTTFPVVLFIDGHSSHLSLHLSNFCSQNKIEVIALYPNSTHLLQPMDVSVFRPLKAAWKKGVDEWRFENNGRKMKKEEFAPILKNVIKKSLTKKTIQSGFEATGLKELDPNKVHYGILIKKNGEAHQYSVQYQESKLRDLRNYLQYIETKVGLEKIQRFSQGDVLLRDESLCEFWRSVKEDIATLTGEINRRRESTNQNPPATEENWPPPANEEAAGSSRSSDIDDPVPVAEMVQEIQGLVVAEATVEGEIVDIDPSMFPDLNLDGLELDILPSDIITLPSPVLPTAAAASTSTAAAASTSTAAAASTSSRPSPSTTPTYPSFPLPSPSSSLKTIPSPSDISPSQSSTIFPIMEPSCILPVNPNLPSPFKRCLTYPTPPSAKKKKLFGDVMPSTITGANFKEYMKRKEEKKLLIEREKERKRIAREEKKKIQDEKVTKKRLSVSVREEDEEDVDNPDSLEPVKITLEELQELNINSWVVVPYIVDDKKVHYPGQIKKIKDDILTVKFLTKKGNKYVWPEEDDVDESVPLTEIVQKLSAPHVERRGYFSFREKIIQA